ncbi:Bro-N domain-containing protein [Chromobacterium haemolyticum]|uniref:Bro-N domain-containing protein n=1 Tax=Chromobacterium haemolyticum TaxID=394935 RepID=A0ABS3GNK6_9NEIS|nr:Bro-N domain-containing protein [Chromobacterium haemolyticum]MBK0415193.1 Bro-N domain-containing protein [Chromobacterium haemolyticum]MBO0416592.1 Bro-N domain-containing protein [Chromobacterium haemolyticum]MBO0499832.1 Bro-N domain-containing protein [Chromobacterium haemolyticum]
MSPVVPFQFDSVAIRVVADSNGEPLFVGKDVCQVLGYVDHTNAMKQHCRGVVKRHPIVDSLGRQQEIRVLTEPDVLRLIVTSTLPAAQAFERWVFEEVLPTIRKSGSFSANPQGVVQEATSALKLTPMAVRAARALGLDKNAAAISASQYVRKVTGVNLLEEFGHTHLVAENQEAMYFTPTVLGKRINVSARQFNLLLAEAGLQMKKGDEWAPTEAAEGFYRYFDTGKMHGSGTPVQQMKWADNVLALIIQAA